MLVHKIYRGWFFQGRLAILLGQNGLRFAYNEFCFEIMGVVLHCNCTVAGGFLLGGCVAVCRFRSAGLEPWGAGLSGLWGHIWLLHEPGSGLGE